MALENFVLVAISNAVAWLIVAASPEETALVHIVYLTGARNLITPQSGVAIVTSHTQLNQFYL